ncbi:MAG: hypothetical protein ABEJ65_07795, partial [bacterium]
SHDAPRWEVQLDVHSDRVDDIVSTLAENESFIRTLAQQDRPHTTGGSRDVLRVEIEDRSFELPKYDYDNERAHDLFGKIKDLVPDKTWDELEQRRLEYHQSNN